jgi:hypothetical protein
MMNLPGKATHYSTDGRTTTCGSLPCPWLASEFRERVNCKRCLASLTKRDREFQRKARKWHGAHVDPAGLGPTWWGQYIYQLSVRAIAREEGRAL